MRLDVWISLITIFRFVKGRCSVQPVQSWHRNNDKGNEHAEGERLREALVNTLSTFFTFFADASATVCAMIHWLSFLFIRTIFIFKFR